MNIASDGTQAFGVSLDLDVIDPLEAPGVGSPEPEGIKESDLLEALALLRSQKKFQGFELVEYNPERDPEGITLEVIYHIIKTVTQMDQGANESVGNV